MSAPYIGKENQLTWGCQCDDCADAGSLSGGDVAIMVTGDLLNEVNEPTNGVKSGDAKGA